MSSSRANRLSVYLPPDAQAVLAGLGGAGNLSATMQSVIERYALVVEHSRPPLTDAEWAFLRRTFANAPPARGQQLRGQFLPLDEWDTAKRGRPEGVDPKSLWYRLRAMSWAQLIAVVEDIEASRQSTQDACVPE